MAHNKRDGKRVRIQSGHQERIIERRGLGSRQRSIKKSTRKTPTKQRMRKMRSMARRANKDQPHWNCKTHRPTVAQVVYQFLERASAQGKTKSQKSNATNQFRQLQRRKRSKRLDVPKSATGTKMEAMALPMKEEYRFPYSKLPSHDGEKSIEKCIYEVLSFGTMLGLLVPADKEGMVFRVSSDIPLFKSEHAKRDQARKRKIGIPDNNSSSSSSSSSKLLEKVYCECETKCN